MVKTVLTELGNGVALDKAGGVSNGQVVRFAAALGVSETEDELVHVAKETTQFTNRNSQPIHASEFWARVSFRIMHGSELEEAIKGAAEATHDEFIQDKVRQAFEKVKEATDHKDGLLANEEFVDDLALTRCQAPDGCALAPLIHRPPRPPSIARPPRALLEARESGVRTRSLTLTSHSPSR